VVRRFQMSASEYELVVIGSGPPGQKCAIAAAKGAQARRHHRLEQALTRSNCARLRRFVRQGLAETRAVPRAGEILFVSSALPPTKKRVTRRPPGGRHASSGHDRECSASFRRTGRSAASRMKFCRSFPLLSILHANSTHVGEAVRVQQRCVRSPGSNRSFCYRSVNASGVTQPASVPRIMLRDGRRRARSGWAILAGGCPAPANSMVRRLTV